MKTLRNIKCLLVMVLAISAVVLAGCGKKTEKTFTVSFMANAGKAEVKLSSGYPAIGNDAVFATVTVKEGEKVTLPEGAPVRDGYDFNGWYADKESTVAWEADTVPTKDISLYAGWKRSTSSSGIDYTEPVYVKKNGTDGGADGFKINNVCNAPVVDGKVQLTAASINMLAASDGDVSALLGYDISSGVTLNSAKYADKTITVEWTGANGAKSATIAVSDVTANYKVDNSTYETKAKNYEAKEAPKAGCVLLAGSSSMENWSTSTADMQPITSANVGIGGTTAQQWTECLAERLVFPYSPRAVVFYVGINNVINAGNTGEETGNAVVELLEKVHERLPETDVYYVLMNLIPGYMKYKDAIEQGNSIVTEFAKGKDWLTMIDAGKSLLKDSGNPNSAYFLSDGLHMSLCGYTIWGKVVRDAVIEKESK